MGFLDKAKAQAQQLATKAQEGVKTGQAKLEQTQAKRKADALLRDLGAAVFAQRTGKGTAEIDAEIERLLSELRTHEAEHGAIDTAPTADEQQRGDDFKLDDL